MYLHLKFFRYDVLRIYSKEFMESKLSPVRNFFYKNGNKPSFAFERTFPISLLETQKELTGHEFKYSNEEYLKYSRIFQILLINLKENMFFEYTKVFFASLLTSLPAVLSSELIKEFKEDFPKLHQYFSESEINLFQEYLDKDIDKAYLFVPQTLSFYIWNKWIEKCASFKQIHDFLNFNLSLFEQAYNLKFGQEDSKQTTKWLGEFFLLNEREQKVLEMLQFETFQKPLAMITEHAESYRYHSFSLDFRKQVAMLAQVYNIEEKDIFEFLKNKKLIESGLIKNNLKGDKYFVDVSVEKNPFSSFFDDKFTLLLKANFDCKQSLIDTIISIEKDFETKLALSDYSHLNPELTSIISSLKNSEEPLDILFWGTPGTGKTELAKVIAKECGLDLCNITKCDPEEQDSFYKNQRTRQLMTAKNFSTILKNYVILVDEAESILTQRETKHLITEQLENKKVHTIWVVNHIENIDTAYLRRFDYIQEIKGMPFTQRKNLSLKLLNGKYNDLAYKIAQAMHTPAEIVSAVSWCHKSNQYTWDSIQLKMSAYQKVLSKAEKVKHQDFAIEIIPPEQNKDKGLQNFAGYEYLHEKANEIKDLFNNPEKYQKIGGKVPKGILLAGGPGVGKTLFAKCLANEISIPIIKADCSALASNIGAIAELFEQARSHAPCMIFLDEIDVIASNVMDKNGANTEKQKILNQLLIQMDGFDPLEGVMVLGATHRDYLLDEAVRRSGRFGDTIYIRSPSFLDRKRIWEFYGQTVLLDKNINYEILSNLSSTMSAADISQCVNMAAMLAASRNQEFITQIDLEQACNKLFWGTDAQGMPITKKEQWKTAIHEAGHALIALHNKQGVKRATVRPHLHFLGAVDLDKPEGTYSMSLQQIKQNTEIFFGGMLAEQIVFGYHANGVISDLAKASSFVMDALLSYGMGQTLGSVVVTSNTPQMSEGRIMALEKEHKKILDDAQASAESWLKDNRELLVNLASLLIKKRSLSQSDLYEWFSSTIHKKTLSFIQEDNDTTFEQLIALAHAK